MFDVFLRQKMHQKIYAKTIPGKTEKNKIKENIGEEVKIKVNNVTDKGETSWPHWDVKLQPEKGLTVIWPPAFTHMHQGIASPSQTKYIVTGWYSHF